MKINSPPIHRVFAETGIADATLQRL